MVEVGKAPRPIPLLTASATADCPGPSSVRRFNVSGQAVCLLTTLLVTEQPDFAFAVMIKYINRTKGKKIAGRHKNNTHTRPVNNVHVFQIP